MELERYRKVRALLSDSDLRAEPGKLLAALLDATDNMNNPELSLQYADHIAWIAIEAYGSDAPFRRALDTLRNYIANKVPIEGVAESDEVLWEIYWDYHNQDRAKEKDKGPSPEQPYASARTWAVGTLKDAIWMCCREDLMRVGVGTLAGDFRLTTADIAMSAAMAVAAHASGDDIFPGTRRLRTWLPSVLTMQVERRSRGKSDTFLTSAALTLRCSMISPTTHDDQFHHSYPRRRGPAQH